MKTITSIKKDITEITDEYFKGLTEDTLCVLCEAIGDCESRGMNYFDDLDFWFDDLDDEEDGEYKTQQRLLESLIREDTEKFKEMFVLVGVVDGWVTEVALGAY